MDPRSPPPKRSVRTPWQLREVRTRYLLQNLGPPGDCEVTSGVFTIWVRGKHEKKNLGGCFVIALRQHPRATCLGLGAPRPRLCLCQTSAHPKPKAAVASELTHGRKSFVPSKTRNKKNGSCLATADPSVSKHFGVGAALHPKNFGEIQSPPPTTNPAGVIASVGLGGWKWWI